MLTQLFGEQPATDTPTRIGQMVGNLIGFAVIAMLTWVAFQGMF